MWSSSFPHHEGRSLDIRLVEVLHPFQVIEIAEKGGGSIDIFYVNPLLKGVYEKSAENNEKGIDQ